MKNTEKKIKCNICFFRRRCDTFLSSNICLSITKANRTSSKYITTYKLSSRPLYTKLTWTCIVYFWTKIFTVYLYLVQYYTYFILYSSSILVKRSFTNLLSQHCAGLRDILNYLKKEFYILKDYKKCKYSPCAVLLYAKHLKFEWMHIEYRYINF